ncbi:sulfatase-like hydrolase/transferase [Haloferax sp. Atlit-19N]|uniref:sulfatase-like hydrolase/transferase n=1 Tax=Haloferax sp. Atlit-19N TaxID=2077201 RepID=UPI001314EE8E|nr:sulfatase-like hydrolase/transferase [Haloferax sp. Atlit-19N]
MVPETVKKLIRPAYFYTLSKQSDIAHSSPEPSEQEGGVDNILLISIDALRPDYTPDLDLTWASAVAPSTWTFPSVTSYLTGRYPHQHGATAHTHSSDDSFAMPEQASPTETLPGVFERRGYDTLGLFAFPMPFMASRGWFQKHRVWADEPAETLVSKYKSWSHGREKTFAYIHLGDLHAPITPPKEYIEKQNVDTDLSNLEIIHEYTNSYDGSEKCRNYREQRLKLYQAALNYVEDTLQELLRNQDENTLVLIYGDHGEAHWEHYEKDQLFTDSRPNYGVGHGGTPFDMVSRVPVGVSYPELRPKGGRASLIDLPKTVTDHVFGSSPDEFSGCSWGKGSIPSERSVICEGVRYGPERKAVYRQNRKLIRSEADDVTLTAELTTTGEDFNSEFEYVELLNQLPDDWGRGESAKTGRIVEDQLEALGYR